MSSTLGLGIGSDASVHGAQSHHALNHSLSVLLSEAGDGNESGSLFSAEAAAAALPLSAAPPLALSAIPAPVATATVAHSAGVAPISLVGVGPSVHMPTVFSSLWGSSDRSMEQQVGGISLLGSTSNTSTSSSSSSSGSISTEVVDTSTSLLGASSSHSSSALSQLQATSRPFMPSPSLLSSSTASSPQQQVSPTDLTAVSQDTYASSLGEEVLEEEGEAEGQLSSEDGGHLMEQQQLYQQQQQVQQHMQQQNFMIQMQQAQQVQLLQSYVQQQQQQQQQMALHSLQQPLTPLHQLHQQPDNYPSQAFRMLSVDSLQALHQQVLLQQQQRGVPLPSGAAPSPFPHPSKFLPGGVGGLDPRMISPYFDAASLAAAASVAGSSMFLGGQQGGAAGEQQMDSVTQQLLALQQRLAQMQGGVEAGVAGPAATTSAAPAATFPQYEAGDAQAWPKLADPSGRSAGSGEGGRGGSEGFFPQPAQAQQQQQYTAALSAGAFLSQQKF